MVKAGDEALRSAASSEALNYFREVLQTYSEKYGNNADPSKLANFEKNIAIALYNKAQWSEAVNYFDRVLERWGASLPKRGIVGMIRLAWDFLGVIKMSYLKLPNSKKKPRDRDKEVFTFSYNVATALGFFDNTRLLQVMLYMLKRLSKYDLSKIPRIACYWWVGIACVFSVGGLSFKLSNRFLDVSRRYRDSKDNNGDIQYDCLSSMVYHCQGAWEKIKDLDEGLIKASLKFGELWHTTMYLWSYGLIKAVQGDFKQLTEAINRMYEIGETYDYPLSTLIARNLKTNYLVMTHKSHEALLEAEQGIFGSRDEGTELQELMFMGLKAESNLLMGDLEGAGESISRAKEIYKKDPSLIMPLYVAAFMVGRFIFHIEQLKIIIRSGSSSGVSDVSKRTYKCGKAAIGNSRKYAPYRTKILRLMGLYYWLINKQNKAVKCWKKAIEEGEKLGTRPDLARTYMEIGKRFLEEKSIYKDLNGISASKYLEKARTMFQEMDLQWDLDEFDKIAVSS
jgi:tetratricopeptide (TPR) repeat protein